MPAVTGTDVYGWHHMRSFDYWSAARLCTFFLCKTYGNIWDEYLSCSNRTNFYYDFFGWSVADYTFLRFKQ